MLRLYYDRIAIALSGACVAHCVALPIIGGLIPLLDNEFWFHQFILLLILPISIFALISGYRFHKKLVPILSSGAGLFVLVFTAIFAEDLIVAHVIPHSGETWLTIAGGTILAFGHILNYKKTKSFQVECATS